MFGLELSDKQNSVRYWGARAIFHGCRDGYLIDILHDRQTYAGVDADDEAESPARRSFINWINLRGLPKLRELARENGIMPEVDKRIEFREFNYYIRANTKASHGYLYIGACELPVSIDRSGEHPVYTCEDQSGKWTGGGDLPIVGDEGTATVNGLGPCTVVGYFVEAGYIGVQARLDKPPQWWVKQTYRDLVDRALKPSRERYEAEGGKLPKWRENEILSGKGLKPANVAKKHLPPCPIFGAEFRSADAEVAVG